MAPRWDTYRNLKPVPVGHRRWQLCEWQLYQLRDGHWIAHQVFNSDDSAMTEDSVLPALQAPSFDALAVSLRQWLFAIDKISNNKREFRRKQASIREAAEAQREETQLRKRRELKAQNRASRKRSKVTTGQFLESLALAQS